MTAPLKIAHRRMSAWCRILDAVAEQRAALDARIYREDIDDKHLGADVHSWCELTRALADFLQMRRSA